MSVPDSAPLTVTALACGLFEVTALRGRWGEVERMFAARAVRLPGPMGVAGAQDHLVLRVRPQRVLVLSEPGSPQADFAAWRGGCEGVAALVDLSSALTVLQLSGPAREVLRQGCRLDLATEAFAPGAAAATLLAQVPVILAALPADMLLLAPSTLAFHMQDWLAAAAAQPVRSGEVHS